MLAQTEHLLRANHGRYLTRTAVHKLNAEAVQQMHQTFFPPSLDWTGLIHTKLQTVSQEGDIFPMYLSLYNKTNRTSSKYNRKRSSLG